MRAPTGSVRLVVAGTVLVVIAVAAAIRATAVVTAPGEDPPSTSPASGASWTPDASWTPAPQSTSAAPAIAEQPVTSGAAVRSTQSPAAQPRTSSDRERDIGAPAGRPVIADGGAVLAGRPLFGVYVTDRSESGVSRVARSAGCRPTVVQAFASVDAGISARTIRAMPGLPLLSVEPWHTGQGARQSDFTLRATIDGRWDQRYRKIARAIRDYQDVVLVRFAHEMNGRWYPWGVANGNQPGEYAQAWRHVVDLFRAEGVTNALWVWSPNILSGATSRPLREFWPGDKYVDIVGLTGYGMGARSAAQTYASSLRVIATLTARPVLLTEVGVRAGAAKLDWIESFGPWLAANPQVAGFIWNQGLRDGDWRFDDTSVNRTAFRRTLAEARVKC